MQHFSIAFSFIKACLLRVDHESYKMTKKLYVGNLPYDCTDEQLGGLFSKFGSITECKVMGRYAFVHMSTESEAKEAVDNLDSYNFIGSNLNVKYSTGSSGRGGGRGGGSMGSQARTKLYVGNLPMDCTEAQLLKEFSKWGEVAECDVIRNYGFVHMKTESGAVEAQKNLNNMDFYGNSLVVMQSTSRVHKAPGVGSKGECFQCGNRGHLSRECTEGGYDRSARGRGRGRGGSSRGGYPPRGGASDGRSYNGYSSSSSSYDPYYDYPPPRRPLPPADDYYGREGGSRRYADDYLPRRAVPRDYVAVPREYAYALRPRSRSPPPGYRRRLSPAREEYDRYYERLPPRDPYDYPPPRRSLPPPSSSAPPARRLPAAQY
ncbi:RNA-binding protein lark-like isoform X2 [Patiria miniata]|uniref:RNA-binding protein 4.1-like n=1 Tax=Patiria miniata TaxID=46514 RepID=A0A914BGX1_PATMI|nr:RNA-binding protein lark-like isoform X2 [Patiria miniata]